MAPALMITVMLRSLIRAGRGANAISLKAGKVGKYYFNILRSTNKSMARTTK